MMTKLIRHVAVAALFAVVAGCDLLDVSDPTAIEEEDVTNAAGADLLRREAVTRLYGAVELAVRETGALTDELTTISSEDARVPGSGVEYVQWQELRSAATLAIPELLQHAPQAARRAHVGEMFAVRGYATVGLAEAVCPGFPLHDIVDSKPAYGGPLTTDEVFEHAVTDFDSALAYAGDSLRILNLAKIGRARALLGFGRFAEAGAAVDGVLTEYKWMAELSGDVFGQRNFLGGLWLGGFSLTSVGNREGGNGLDFIDANDPRLETEYLNDFLGASFYRATKYTNFNAPIVIASGVEARLIEAEAALQANPNGPQWLTILNTLRTNGQDANGNWTAGTGRVPGLAPLADPGAHAVRVDLLFRERAFWLFGTAHRLGDLRRLIAHYGRASEALFPVGPHWFFFFGNYGSATSLSFPAALESPFSPSVTGCTDQ